MPLDISRLEKVKRLSSRIIARCPACGETGNDKSGNHLSIWPDGAFACVVARGDKEHRRRIWQLAGDNKPRALIIYKGQDQVLL